MHFYPIGTWGQSPKCLLWSIVIFKPVFHKPQDYQIYVRVVIIKRISPNSHQPIYYQLKQIIIEAIQSGEYKANDKLPTEKELCEMYGISKAPVRQALQELEDENFIYKIRGKGSYVLSGYIKAKATKLRSFSEEIIDLGHKPGAKLLDNKIVNADSEIAENLKINEDDEVLMVVRLRYIDEEIYSLIYSFFPIKNIPNLDKVDFSAVSIMEEVEKKLGIEMTFATVVLEATATMAEHAEILERKTGSPLLLMNRVTYCRMNQSEIPFEFVKVYFVPEKYKFEIQLTNK
jgi:GntR family transcriptional regulator